MLRVCEHDLVDLVVCADLEQEDVVLALIRALDEIRDDAGIIAGTAGPGASLPLSL